MYALLIAPPLPQKNSMSAGTLIGRNEKLGPFSKYKFCNKIKERRMDVGTC
jgi:hypothetical protein